MTHNEAPFSANFHLYNGDGLRVQFTVRGDGEPAANIPMLQDTIAQLAAHGYTVAMPGLEPGEQVEEVDAWVLGETSKGDACVYLYSSNHALKWRVATVYVERLGELPFSTANAKAWPGGAPEREPAANKGYLHTVTPFKIVMEPTGKTTDNGNEVTRFARVLDAKPDQQPPQNGNGKHAPDLRAQLEERKSWPLGQVANMVAATGRFDDGNAAIEAMAMYPFDEAQQEALKAGKFELKATQKVSRDFALAAFDWLTREEEAQP